MIILLYFIIFLPTYQYVYTHLSSSIFGLFIEKTDSYLACPLFLSYTLFNLYNISSRNFSNSNFPIRYPTKTPTIFVMTSLISAALPLIKKYCTLSISKIKQNQKAKILFCFFSHNRKYSTPRSPNGTNMHTL